MSYGSGGGGYGAAPQQIIYVPAPQPVFYQVPAAPRPVIPIPAPSYGGGGYGGGSQGGYGGGQSAPVRGGYDADLQQAHQFTITFFSTCSSFIILSIGSNRPILPATNSSDSLRGRT